MRKFGYMAIEGLEPIELPENAGTLMKFDDMKDLLLLDPIHDVDEAGCEQSALART